uniref:Uncharacterized protein n=1 Tax=Oryza punctata TaxID=4537 RepID=A0A0E0L5P9_ORYPU
MATTTTGGAERSVRATAGRPAKTTVDDREASVTTGGQGCAIEACEGLGSGWCRYSDFHVLTEDRQGMGGRCKPSLTLPGRQQ